MMDINVNPSESAALLQLGIELSELAVKGTVATISNRIKIAKANKDNKKIIEEYDEILSELISERAEAIRIAQSYKDVIDRYEISDEDITHLNKTISRILDIIKEMSPEANVSSFEQFKELISVDTLKAFQLLGFNYKDAIGIPLTRLCASYISRHEPNTSKSVTISGKKNR